MPEKRRKNPGPAQTCACYQETRIIHRGAIAFVGQNDWHWKQPTQIFS
jgi:hypothetical protein